MIRYSLFLGIAVSFSVAGCMSAGTQVSAQQIDELQRGVTTEAQTIAKLGKPTSTSTRDDGSRVDVYVFTKATPDAVDFVPVVGLLAGGATGSTSLVTLSFDKNGVLQAIERQESNVRVNTGL